MAQKPRTSKTVQPKNLPGGQLNNFLNKFSNFSEKMIDFKKSKKIYIIVFVIALALLAVYKKSWFVAAMVDGSPITNFELQARLNDQFRNDTLNQLITEKIILAEAAKNNAIPSESEINQKISEIETRMGGPQALDNLLAQQKQTRQSIKQPIKLQMAMEKLYAKDATVSAEEVAKFIETNKDQLRATDSATQEKEAYDAIKNQKLNQVSYQKFQQLRQKAQVQMF